MCINIYLQNIYNQIVTIHHSENNNLLLEKEDKLSYLNEAMNPYYFLFNPVNKTNTTVSILKPFSSMFYIYIEIIHTFKLLNTFQNEYIYSICYGKESQAVSESIHFCYENSCNIYKDSENINDHIDLIQKNIHFLSYELNNNGDYNNGDYNYVNKLISVLCNILHNQIENGCSIIKISTMIHRPILDILYVLTFFYEKVNIIKPSVSLQTTDEKYIVCKNLILETNKREIYKSYLFNLLKKINEENITIKSLFNKKLPYYFINKMDECNVIFGNLQLENLDLLLGIYKKKNRKEKVEILKKTNIIQCIKFCEKYKIPHNKFPEIIVNVFMLKNTNNFMLSP